jgi:SAM-dependent methyltransferase
MTEKDVERFGRDILDPATRKRWCGAVLLGGLPYLWNQSCGDIRREAIERLRIRPGHRVFLLGEEVEGIGFHQDIMKLIGADGELKLVDVREQVLAMFFAGNMPQWEYDFTRDYPDNYFDSIFVGQGVAHAEDWAREGAELLRVLKPGGALVMAEISFSSVFWDRVDADVHLTYWVQKMMEGLGHELKDLPRHDMNNVASSISDHVEGLETKEWRGCDLLWCTKP